MQWVEYVEILLNTRQSIELEECDVGGKPNDAMDRRSQRSSLQSADL